MVTECHAGFGQRGSAGRPRQELDTELGFKPDQPATDDGF